MTLKGFSFTRYRQTYNRLSDNVDQSFGNLLLRKEYTAAIHGVLDLIQKHKADDFLGVLLLHRHFPAERDTLFLERPHTPPVKGHETTLVTAPASKGALPAEIVPHRFHVSREGDLQPLEFTTDRLAAAGWKRLESDRRLLKAVGQRLAAGKFSSLLGVGIYPREAGLASATTVYIEETDFENKMSVVHALPSLPRVAGRLIPTLWSRQNTGNGCCTVSCIAYCSHPSGGQLGYCGHRKDGHVGCV
jgi:hypothetical protein